jgi:TnpA family transposase
MPLTFLTQAERERYQQIPLPLSETDLRQFFHLSVADQLFVKSFHGEVNRLSISFQLGVIRFLGYLPTQWQWQSDTQILDFLSGQIGLAHLPNSVLDQYGHREKTQTEHLQRILKYLTYRKWQPMDELFFESWLIEQGMTHDNERILLDQLCQSLHKEKILRPAIGTLERMVAGIGERLHEETYRRLSLLWNQECHQTLDKLLEIDQEKKVTLHRWLCQEPTHNSPKAINPTIERITYLHHLGVPTWNVSMISLNRRKRLTAIARNNSNHYLLRMAPIKRYSILVCFLWETLLNTTDTVLTMFDDYWEHIVNGAKRSLENYQLSVIQSQNQAVQTLTKAVEMIVDESIDDYQLRILIFQQLPKELLQKALEMAGGNHPSLRYNHLFYLLNYYACLRQFIPNLLKTIVFESAFNKDNFFKALSLVIELQTVKRKKLPQEVSTDFITPSWGKWVLEKTPPKIVQKPYELCVLSVLRDRLLSGDIFVRLSRKYADFNSFLIDQESWKEKKTDYCQQLGGTTTTLRIEERINELENLLKPLDELLKAGIEIRLDEGVLVVPPLLAEDIPVSAKELQAHINQRLPKVNLVEMIREVDSWLHFSKELQPMTAETKRNQARNEDHTTLLYAALFAQACNLSVSDLARSSDLDYSSLWWVGNNYLIEENLKRANDTLVNFHHKQWLCGYWGGGTLSSSDGQRFPTSGKIRNAKALPSYYGYGKGVTFYTHTSDQYSQYGTKVIASTERDATYVLDEIVGNETDLPILEHTTDTAGYVRPARSVKQCGRIPLPLPNGVFLPKRAGPVTAWCEAFGTM